MRRGMGRLRKLGRGGRFFRHKEAELSTPSEPFAGRRRPVTYVELQVSTHFSFLRGVSSAEELFSAAALLGYPALGVADRNSVGGLVKALRAADATGVRLVAGCRLELMEPGSGGTTGLLVWPEDRAGWSRLTR